MRRAAVRSLARQCGLTGALGTVLPHQGDEGEHGAGSAAFHSLRDAVFEKAWATVDPKRAKIALDWFAAYLGLTGRCRLYTSDAADDLLCVRPGGLRILYTKD